MRRRAPPVLKALRPALRRKGIALRRADKILDAGDCFHACLRPQLDFSRMVDEVVDRIHEMGNPTTACSDRLARRRKLIGGRQCGNTTPGLYYNAPTWRTSYG